MRRIGTLLGVPTDVAGEGSEGGELSGELGAMGAEEDVDDLEGEERGAVRLAEGC
jgi:hypothetical protein